MPASARSAITLRIVAGLRPSRLDRASVRDPTGSPVAIKVSTMAVRISRSRSPMGGTAGITDPYLNLTGDRPRLPLWVRLAKSFECKNLGLALQEDPTLILGTCRKPVKQPHWGRRTPVQWSDGRPRPSNHRSVREVAD